MGLVTNDEPVYETPAERKVADAGTVLDDSNPVVLANPGAFRPVGPAKDEGEGRTSAVAADPTLQAEGPPKSGHAPAASNPPASSAPSTPKSGK